MTIETTDSGAKSAFVFPAIPQNAVLRLTIKVEEVLGEGLLMSATLTPGGKALEHQNVEDVFRQARSAPQPGTYIFEATEGTTIVYVSGPEKVSACEARDMAFFLVPTLCQQRDQLVEALRVFPSAGVIDEAARRIVHEVVGGSLDRSPLEVKPVVDARTVEVQGVKCATCANGGLGSMSGGLLEFLNLLLPGNIPINDGITTVGNMKFAIHSRGGVPVVRVGYLSHDSGDFAQFLNGILGEHIREAVQAVALKEVIEMLVRAENGRRQFCRMAESIQATYSVDPGAIVAGADSLDEDRRALAPEDGDGMDGDGTNYEDSPPPIEG